MEGVWSLVTKFEIAQAKLVSWDLLLKVKHNMAKCPFHDDKHESMSIKFGVAHCFTCNENWDKISFVMERDKLGFVAAVRSLICMFPSTAGTAAGAVPHENIIFDEFGGWQMLEPNVGKWFVPDSWREEFKDLRRNGGLKDATN